VLWRERYQGQQASEIAARTIKMEGTRSSMARLHAAIRRRNGVLEFRTR
jgi:hypothetical protein